MWINAVGSTASYTDLFTKTKVHGCIYRCTKKEGHLFLLRYFVLRMLRFAVIVTVLWHGLGESSSFSNASHCRHFPSQFLKCISIFIACSRKWYLSGKQSQFHFSLKIIFGMGDMWISIKSVFWIEGEVGASLFLPENVTVDSLWRYSLSYFCFWMV